MKCLNLLPLLALFFLSSATTKVSQNKKNAFDFIDAMQNPANCTGAEYAVVDMGCGGGFAAHFQLAAAEWLKVAGYFNYSKPVLIVGHIRGYSDGPECHSVNKDWTCFFLPMSACQSTLLSTGKRLDLNYKGIDESVIPMQFRHLGLAWWWGLVQARMFRFQPPVETHIFSESSKMDGGKGFPFSYPVAGLHVRHGDKSSDGFKHHSLDNEMAAVRKSPECLLDSSPVSTSRVCRSKPGDETVTAATGSAAVKDNDLRVFVASDDPHVLASARQLGHLVDSEGVSQHTATAGMFKTLVSKPELGYNATLEIITDIYFLSQCSTLVGTAASQIFRMAVGLSNSSEILKYAVAMDYDQLPKIQKMSAKYDLPVPEHFAMP